MTKNAVRPLVWIVAAVAVTATATALITASLMSNNSVRSPDDVERALAAATATPTGTATGTPTGTPTGTATMSTDGSGGVVSSLIPGIVTVRCDGALATLVSWSPNPGWRADDPYQGPAAHVSVRFESDVYEDYKVTASCVDGEPVVNLGPDVDDHDDHSGPGHGGDDDHDDDSGRGGDDSY
jgi:hypothetical protein